jgi:glycosyltransferase involved in cell wall biosynthesis
LDDLTLFLCSSSDDDSSASRHDSISSSWYILRPINSFGGDDIKYISNKKQLTDAILYYNTHKNYKSHLYKNDVICKKNLKKNILNYYIKKSYFTILPLQRAPGTKIKVIENLILGKTIIGTKFAFRGIKIMKNAKNLIIYKSFSDLCKKVNFFIKNEKIITQKISATKNFYVKNYSISNIIKKFIYENKIDFI